jgi:hypothetical protein
MMKIDYPAFGTFGGPAPQVLTQLRKQAGLNRCAAAATGASVLLQAIASWLPC